MKSLSGKVISMLMFACLFPAVYAQSLDQAKKLYNEGQYGEAKPAFEKLVNQSPNNSSYNLWYGVCCFETGDMATAETHLLVARQRKVAEAYRYLADIYTVAYRFDEAARMWEDYIELLEKKKEDTEVYEMQLEQVEKRQRMKEKTENIQVIDSMVVNKDQILSAYFLSEDCGVLETYRNHFQSSESVSSTVYIKPKGDQAYYARPSQDDRYALYTHSRLMDTWTDEKLIFPSDLADNNYPFVLGDGLTLYFASKGNGSIGGYDLFVTRYNINSNAYLAPEQMGMPFNSPANDYLMVIDEAKGVGWFVSDRNQPEGKACVYLFIPDESRKRIGESEDDEWLRKRAMLSSIKDTWVSDPDYAGLIRTAQTDASSTHKTVENDFEFVINDRTTYYTWSEFRSAEAKALYEKAAGVKKQIAAVENKLDESRGLYTAGNKAARNRLSPSILQAEAELETLYGQAHEWEKKARNKENTQIKN
ncbi:MAG: tetratricopeptide repeat protein [Prevotellaceae bacterium]|jgi:tetratricopeptide (TPR) repeat protein|nr:tetratricopeptide repeat protein [Prevotellaceae bacterium]